MTIEERMDGLESMVHGTAKDHRYASNGKGNAGVALGSVGTALGALGLLGGANGLGGILGGGWGNQPVSRYDSEKDAEIARLNTELKLRDANIYTDQKSLEFYRYIDTRFREFEAALANQAVVNQGNKDSFQILQERLDHAKHECCDAIAREADARKCADNAIVSYVNATFYPKMVADVTVGTATTAQTVYNPLPVSGGCGCRC